MNEPLHISRKESGENLCLFSLKGDLDSQTARDFEDFYEGLLAEGKNLFLLEVFRLRYVSSAGLGVLVKLSERLRRSGGAGAFLGLNVELNMLFDFFGLTSHMASFDSEEKARAYLRSRPSKRPAASSFGRRPLVTEASSIPKTGSIPETKSVPETRSVPGTKSVPDVSPAEIQESEATELFDAGAQPMPESSDLKQIIRDEVLAELEKQKTPVGAGAASPRSVVPAPFREKRVPVQREAPPSEAREFSENRLIECEQCGTSLRFSRSGLHLCPSCMIRIRVRRDGTAMFLEKL